VLEEHRPAAGERRAPAGMDWPAELCLWQAEDGAALARRVDDQLRELAGADTPLREIARQLARAWRAGGETLALVATSREDLAAKLAAAAAALRDPSAKLPAGVYRGRPERGAKLAVLFPGQGSQYPEMLRELALCFPLLSDTLARADEELRGRVAPGDGNGGLLSHFIYPRAAFSAAGKTAAAEALKSTDVAQPALGAVEAGLWALLRQLGLRADMLGGHSYGELVALHAAGTLDFATLMELSAGRGRAIVDAARQAGSELGTMAAVQARRPAVEQALQGVDGVIAWPTTTRRSSASSPARRPGFARPWPASRGPGSP
jgi:acyl transferase domain-containing protein